MIFDITKEKLLKEVKLDFFSEEVTKYSYLLNDNEHYRLLVYLSYLFDGITILDLGTCQGHSAVALSQNKNNKVITYDIDKKENIIIDNVKNIEFRLLDINLEDDFVLEQAKIILLDIDPHDGVQEAKFYNKLRNINFKGILICDDINLNDGMIKFWSNITEEKYDITDIGHWSGTGIVYMY